MSRAGSAPASASASEGVAEAVRANYAAQLQALLAGDAEALARLLSDDFSQTHITGSRQSRDQWLTAVRSGEMTYHAVEVVDVSVDLTGEAPMLAARIRTDATIWGSRATWPLSVPHAVHVRRHHLVGGKRSRLHLVMTSHSPQQKGQTMTSQIPDITLNNGVRMPIIGFGVYQIPPEQTEQAVTDALAAGYRHIDTAAAYVNEEAVGRAISASGIPRDELFVTTKLWVSDTGEEATQRAVDRSLQRLGLDHLDLYLIHQPFGDVYGSWRAMERLQGEGVLRAIGVSNFYPDRLVDLIDHNEVTPAVNQIETHPYFQRADYQALMAERGVQIESWGPFAEGRNDLFSDPVLSAIGAAHGKTVAQVVLRWLIHRSVVVIPKSVRPERMRENIDVFDFALTDDEMACIAEMDTGASLFLDHRDPAVVSQLGTYRLP